MKSDKNIIKYFIVLLILTLYYLILLDIVRKDLFILSSLENICYFQIAFILILSILGFTIAMIFSVPDEVLLASSLTLSMIIPIVNSALAWGDKVLGHEDYCRDLRWAELMSVNGVWKPHFAGGNTAYTLFPAHSFMEYVLSMITEIGIHLTGVIYFLPVKILVLVTIYSVLKNISLYGEQGLLVRILARVMYIAISLTIAGTVVSAQAFAIALIYCYLLLFLKQEKHNAFANYSYILILLTTAISIFHISVALFIVIQSLTLLILGRLQNKMQDKKRCICLTLLLIPIAYYSLNQYVSGQASGFIKTLINAILGKTEKQTLEFSATIEYYTSPLWLAVYYELFIIPLFALLFFYNLIQKFNEFKNNIGLIAITLSLLTVAGIGIIASLVTFNSVYYRYVISPYRYLMFALTIYLLIRGIVKCKTNLIKMIFHVLSILVLILSFTSPLLTNIHHASAPLLHEDLDIVRDLRSSISQKIISSLTDINFVKNKPTIGTFIGINPYGTSDYWIIRYNVLQGNVPKDSFIMAISYKRPLGMFLTEYFVNSKSVESIIIYNDGRTYFIQYI